MTKATSSSAYSSTSSSSSRISSVNQNYDDRHYKSNSHLSSASDYDIENDAPIKLDTELSRHARKLREPILRTVASGMNAAPRLSSTTANNLTSVTSGSAQAFSHNSLPRSRSRSRSGTPTDLISQATAALSYRSGTVASSRKSIQQSNAESLAAVVSTESPRAKSSYKPLSSQLAALQKKKAFY